MASAVSELDTMLSSSSIWVIVVPATVRDVSVLMLPVTWIGELMFTAVESLAVMSSTVIESLTSNVTPVPDTVAVTELPDRNSKSLVPVTTEPVLEAESDMPRVVGMAPTCVSTYALIDC